MYVVVKIKWTKKENVRHVISWDMLLLSIIHNKYIIIVYFALINYVYWPYIILLRVDDFYTMYIPVGKYPTKYSF